MSVGLWADAGPKGPGLGRVVMPGSPRPRPATRNQCVHEQSASCTAARCDLWFRILLGIGRRPRSRPPASEGRLFVAPGIWFWGVLGGLPGPTHVYLFIGPQTSSKWPLSDCIQQSLVVWSVLFQVPVTVVPVVRSGAALWASSPAKERSTRTAGSGFRPHRRFCVAFSGAQLLLGGGRRGCLLGNQHKVRGADTETL